MCITSLLVVCQTIRGPFKTSHCAILTNFYTVAFLLLTPTSFKYVKHQLLFIFFNCCVFIFPAAFEPKAGTHCAHWFTTYMYQSFADSAAEFSLQTIDERKKRNLFVICVGFVFFLICLDF